MREKITAEMMIIRSLVPVVAACSIASADPSPAPKVTRTRIPTQGCLDPKDPKIANAQTAAAEKTSAARKSAMAPIRSLALPARTIEIGKGLSSDPRKTLRGPVATQTINGVTSRFVVGPSGWSGEAVQVDRAWQFGIVNGKAVHLIPQPQRVSETTIAICGCRPHVCGPVGSGCPGCGSTSQTSFGPLPDALDYAGDHVVPYPEHAVTLDFAGTGRTACPAPRACPKPP